MNCRLLTLAFLRPALDDHIENRLTAAMSAHGICHTELVFEDGVAFSIVQGSTAGLRARTLSNPNYETVTLSVTAAEYATCLRFCREIHNHALGFDTMGMYLCLFHPGCFHRNSLDVGKTFCSKVITEALQHACVAEVDGLDPSSTTPSGLYHVIRGSGRRMCHTVRQGVIKRPPAGALLGAPPALAGPPAVATPRAAQTPAESATAAPTPPSRPARSCLR